jgi:hypothetical protein
MPTAQPLRDATVMAAPEQGSPRDSDEALVVFRTALEQHRGDGADIDHIHFPLRQFCAHAVREQMTPEQVVIRVKHALEGLAAFDARHPTERQSIRNRIVSLAILTYYADRSGDGN